MLFYKWWELTQYIFILRLLSYLEHMSAISENGIYFEHIICFEILRIEKHNGQNTCKKRFTNIELIVVVQSQSHVPLSVISWTAAHQTLYE